MDFIAARKHMVDSQIRCNDVMELDIQRAFEKVAREDFLPSGRKEQAYVEREIALSEGRSLITARDFAKLLQAAKIQASDLVLDVATGYGYSAAVISHLCEMVVATEPDEDLATRAQENLSAADISNAVVLHAEAATGAPKQGPFNVIVMALAAEQIPQSLLDQLAEGGRLVTILAEGGMTRGIVTIRSADNFSRRRAFDATSKTVLPALKRAAEFQF